MNTGVARNTTSWFSPLFVGRMDEESYATQQQTNDSEGEKAVELNTKTLKSIEALRQTIFQFKYDLYKESVINDKVHSANTMESMRIFHAVFLQTIAHFISLLDSAEVPPPTFSSTIQPKFNSIQKSLVRILKSNRESYALLYNMLFQFSTQHPFDLGTGGSEDLEPDSENGTLE